jgi:hemolysin activation/secretion protein
MSKILAGTFAALASLSLGTSVAFAQNYDQVAPSAPKPNPKLDELPSEQNPAASPATRAETEVLGNLKGLVLLSAPSKVQAEGVATNGVDTTDIGLLASPEIKDALAARIGKRLTLGDLDEIVRQIVSWYREHDHPLVDVVVPEQSLELGAVQLVVTEFRVGAVKAEGARWFAADDLVAGVRVKPGETVSGQQLLDDINALNANPFRRVDLVYRPGAAVGTADIVLRTEDRFPLRVFASFDNSGTLTTGRDRWGLGFNWGDAFWQGHLLSYQFTTSDDFWHNRPQVPGQPDNPSFVAHSLSYVISLPWRDTLEVFGSYARTTPRGTGFFNLTGEAGQASLRYGIALPKIDKATETLELGYDFKTTNNDLAFGGFRLLSTVAEIDQFPVSLDIDRPDSWGSTSGSVSLVWSPGGLSTENRNVSFDLARASATASYVYGGLKLNRRFALPSDLELDQRLSWQWSKKVLLPSEQLGAGGASSVRGYDERVANGDNGLLLSTELRLPPIDLSNLQPGSGAQFYGFWDYATLHNNVDAIDEARSANLSSLGLGITANWGDAITVRCDYGWQLRRAPNAPDTGEFGHVSIVVAY